MNRDLAFGLSGAAIAGGYYWLAASIRQSALADTVGPQGLPKAYALVLALLSLTLMARSLGERRSGAGDGAADRSPIPRVLGMLAMGAAYIALVPWLGYAVTLAGLLLAVTWYLSGAITRATVIVAVSGATVLWLLFVRLLGIAHPAGVWPRLF